MVVLIGVLVFLLYVWCRGIVCFETDDDYAMMTMLAGFKTGTPIPDTLFCNITWGFILSSLYKITGAISWYALFYFAILYLSYVVIYDACIKIFVTKKYLFGSIVFLWLYFCVFCWYTSILQFTTIPAFSGLAAILLMNKEKISSSINIINKRTILFSVLVFFTSVLRRQTGYMFLVALIAYGLVLRIFYKVKVKK